MADERYEEKDQYPELIDGGQVDEAIVNQAPIDKGVFNVGITATQIKRVVGDVGGSGGTEVVANPTGAATETLTKLQVEDTIYGIPNELPATTSATAGQVLSLDANKEPSWASIQEGMEVVEIANSSGTFSDSDFAKVSGNNCLIKYLGVLFCKTYQDNNTIQYAYPLTDWSGYDLINSRINIVVATKGFSIVNDTVIEVNPNLDGTEGSLSSIQFASTKYKVGGTQLYLHQLTLQDMNQNTGPELLIISKKSTDLTLTDFSRYSMVVNGTVLSFVSIANENDVDQTNIIAIQYIAADGALRGDYISNNGTGNANYDIEADIVSPL